MNALAPVAPKISALLPLLGSAEDGEVIAAVCAIRRVLSSAGADWHDVAKAIAETRALSVSTVRPGPGWVEKVHWLQANDGGRLDLVERTFLRDMKLKSRQPSFCPSMKQGAWIDRLYARLTRWVP